MWIYFLNVLIALFGILTIIDSDKRNRQAKWVLSVVFVFLILLSTFLTIAQSQKESVQEANWKSKMLNGISDLQVNFKQKDSEELKLIEHAIRPQVRIESDEIRFDRKTQSLIFPLRNYGESIATNVTMKFDCDQLLNHIVMRQEDLPPGNTLLDFGFRLFLPVPANSEIDQKYRQFANDFSSGRKALVFTISGSYCWNEKRYEIPERSGIWTSDGKITITLSEAARMSTELKERNNP